MGAKKFARNPGAARYSNQGRPIDSPRLVARLRMPGTNIAGIITAGTFYQDGKRIFWDVHNPDHTIMIELKDERYNELIVEVSDPSAAVEMVRARLA